MSARLSSWAAESLPYGSGAGVARVRAAVYGLTVAESQGWSVEGTVGEHAVALVRGEDKALLAPLGFRVTRGGAGAEADVDRLLHHLESAFAGRRFIVHLRRPVPKDLDPVPVSRAVQLWLAAVDRGQWQGRSAVYDDEGVSLELTVPDLPPTDPGSSKMLVTPPLQASVALGDAALSIAAIALEAEEVRPDVPVVAVCFAADGWQLPRGTLTQLLYGTARRVVAENDGKTAHFEGEWRATGLTLFSDPASRGLASVWWVSPGESIEGVTGFATDNPWCDASPARPTFPGRRFEARPTEGVGSRISRPPVVMRWVYPTPK